MFSLSDNCIIIISLSGYWMVILFLVLQSVVCFVWCCLTSIQINKYIIMCCWVSLPLSVVTTLWPQSVSWGPCCPVPLVVCPCVLAALVGVQPDLQCCLGPTSQLCSVPGTLGWLVCMKPQSAALLISVASCLFVLVCPVMCHWVNESMLKGRSDSWFKKCHGTRLKLAAPTNQKIKNLRNNLRIIINSFFFKHPSGKHVNFDVTKIKII